MKLNSELFEEIKLDDESIFTLSLQKGRVFRMRRWLQKGFKDLRIRNGNIIIVPWNTNLKWTRHKVAC